MWSDNESDIDLLRFSYLAAAVKRIITTAGILPTTVGVFGDWGSGKSTVLKMVERDLASEPGVLTLSFNGWLFEGYENAKTALMGSILDAIKARIGENTPLMAKAGERLLKLLRRVNFLQVAGAAVRYGVPLAIGVPQLTVAALAIDAGKAALDKAKDFDPEELKKFLRDAPEAAEAVRRDIREFRDEFQKLLDEAEIETLVVFIDDLDRCLPGTVIATLEAIKLFLFVPKTAFVIGADERLVQYAVRERFPELPGPEAEVGRDYLEKLVQFPVRVPPLNAAEVESYMGLLFAARFAKAADFSTIVGHVAASAADVTSPSFDMAVCRKLFPSGFVTSAFEADIDLTAQVAPVLAPGLSGSPRRTKRFLNTLLLRLTMASDRRLELNQRVLAKLMLLEYLKPEFFRQLARVQASEGGKPRDLAAAETSTGDAEAGDATREDPPKRATTKSAATRAADDLHPWLADEWMRTWLAAEPKLADVDLRPYFYIAHDKVGATDAVETRLSPAARAALQRLVSVGEASQALGLKDAAGLGTADITAVLEVLAARIRAAEIDDARKHVLTVIKLSEAKSEIVPQVVTLLASLPDAKIPLAGPMALVSVVAGTPNAATVKPLVARWKASVAKGLPASAAAAEERLG